MQTRFDHILEYDCIAGAERGLGECFAFPSRANYSNRLDFGLPQQR